MLINKKTKQFLTRSDMPNSNWLNEEWYVIPDNSSLARKVQRLFPYFNFAINSNGKLVDVVEIPKTQEEIKRERKIEIKLELEVLDKDINRATEDLYMLAKIIPYEKTREIIQKKKELREELKSLETT